MSLFRFVLIAVVSLHANQPSASDLSQGADECFFGGWPSFVVGGYCRHPKTHSDLEWAKKRMEEGVYIGDVTLAYKECPTESEFRCSPMLFGVDSKENGVCIDHGASFYGISQKCDLATRENIDSLAASLIRNQRKAETYGLRKGIYASLLKKIDDFCDKYSASTDEYYDHSGSCEGLRSRVKELRDSIAALGCSGNSQTSACNLVAQTDGFIKSSQNWGEPTNNQYEEVAEALEEGDANAGAGTTHAARASSGRAQRTEPVAILSNKTGQYILVSQSANGCARIITSRTDRDNLAIWRVEAVPGTSDAFHLIEDSSGWALAEPEQKSCGGSAFSLEPRSSTSISQQWRFVPIKNAEDHVQIVNVRSKNAIVDNFKGPGGSNLFFAFNSTNQYSDQWWSIVNGVSQASVQSRPSTDNRNVAQHSPSERASSSSSSKNQRQSNDRITLSSSYNLPAAARQNSPASNSSHNNSGARSCMSGYVWRSAYYDALGNYFQAGCEPIVDYRSRSLPSGGSAGNRGDFDALTFEKPYCIETYNGKKIMFEDCRPRPKGPTVSGSGSRVTIEDDGDG